MYNPFEEIAKLNKKIKELKNEAVLARRAEHAAKLKYSQDKRLFTSGKITSEDLTNSSQTLTDASKKLNDLKAQIRTLKNEVAKIEGVFILLALGLLGTAATAAIFGPQIVAGATVAFLAAKPYLIALGAMVWAGLVKLGTTIAAHKVAASVIATTTATAAVLTPTLYFKKSRECVGNALVDALATYGKAWSPEPGCYRT